MTPPNPSVSAIEMALERVLSGAAFRGRPRLRRLLTHLVHHSLTDRGDALTEYALGLDIFDRGPGFDPRCDSIVRVEAFNLRRALSAHYRGEGATDLVTITIPKGGYWATFGFNPAPPAPILDDPERFCSQVEWALLQGTPDDVNRMGRYVRHAIDRWPDRADLRVVLAASALTALELECVPSDEGIAVMLQAAHAAARLDASRVDAQFFGSIHEVRNPNKAAAIRAAHRWAQYSPKNALARFWMGSTLAASGTMNEVRVHLQGAARLQPYATCFQTWLAVALFCTGEPDVALRHLRDLLAFEPRDYLANYWLGLLASHAGLYDEACEAARKAYEVSDGAQALAGLGFAEARAGRVEAAESVLTSLDELGRSQYVAAVGPCAIHAALGQLQEAARGWALARAHGDWELGWCQPDPRWDPLRGKVAGI